MKNPIPSKISLLQHIPAIAIQLMMNYSFQALGTIHHLGLTIPFPQMDIHQK